MHVDGKTADGCAGALWPLRTWPTTLAGSDVDIGAVAITPTAVVELLTCGTAIAVAFRLTGEPLRAVERAVLSVDTIAGSHVSSDAPIRQPLQELPVAIRCVSRQRFRCSALPLRETCEHVLGGHRLLTHPCCCRLDTHDHAALIVHQIVIVITQPGGRPAFRGISRVRIGGRYLILLVYRFFHWVLLFQFHKVSSHRTVDLGCFRQLFAWNPALLGRIRLDEAAVHRQVFALHQPHFHTLPYDLFKQLLK